MLSVGVIDYLSACKTSSFSCFVRIDSIQIYKFGEIFILREFELGP